MAKETAAGAAALNSNRVGLARPGFPRITEVCSLGGLVEGEIIPRLLMAHRGECARSVDRAHGAPARDRKVDFREAARFATLPLSLEAEELLETVEAFLDRGVGVESVLIDLLAPSARRLGELWEEDRCDFVDVTMGLWRLQEVMRVIALRSPPVARAVSGAPSALFSPMPGDQHSFGALMVEEIFARAGWDSDVLFEPKRQELLATLAQKTFDLVGLTASCDCPSAPLADLVSSIRSVSRNPAIRVIIGGRAINADPGLVARIGADGTARDGSSALALAERMMADAQVLIY